MWLGAEECLRFFANEISQMKIAVLTNLYPPIQTGTAQWAQQLAKSLAESGDEVVVIACNRDGVYHEEVREGVTIYRLPPMGKLPSSSLFFNFDEFLLINSRANRRRVVEIFKKHEIEAVHVASQILDSTLLAHSACRTLNLPSVCSIHTYINHPANRFFNFMLKVVDRTLMRHFVMRKFSAIVALDDPGAKYITKTYRPKRMEWISTCIDDEALKLEPARPGRPDEVINIVSVGHLDERRSREDLLKALSLLKKEGLRFKLRIAGKITRARTLDRIRELDLVDEVEPLGEVQHAELFDVLREAHIEAHWLDTIPGVGHASMESLALGLPVVTYGYEGVFGEVPFKHGENIMFITPGDVPGIADAIRQLVGDPVLRGEMGVRARQLIKDHLNWNVLIRSYRELYADLIGS